MLDKTADINDSRTDAAELLQTILRGEATELELAALLGSLATRGPAPSSSDSSPSSRSSGSGSRSAGSGSRSSGSASTERTCADAGRHPDDERRRATR